VAADGKDDETLFARFRSAITEATRPGRLGADQAVARRRGRCATIGPRCATGCNPFSIGENA
jgi:hypothetical protein